VIREKVALAVVSALLVLVAAWNVAAGTWPALR